jgi:hypothetical protein
MAGSLTINRKTDGPWGLSVALTATGGSWNTDNYAILLVAWDDPLEEDFTLARMCNQPGLAAEGNSFDTTSYTSVTTFTTGAGDNDIVTLSWTPPRRLPHHYTAYVNVGALISGTLAGDTWIKIRPSSGTTQALEIPGWATSAVFANRTSVTETRHARIRLTSANAYYEIEGAHGLALYDGASYSTDAAGAATTNGVPVGRFVDNEERTRVNESATGVSETLLTYTHGPGKWTNSEYTILPHTLVTLTLTTAFVPEWREKNGIDFKGSNIELAYVGGADVARAVLQCTHGGLSLVSGYYSQTTGAAALAYLHKLRRLAQPVALTYKNSSNSEIYNNAVYYGTIEEINELGYVAVQDNQRIEIVFKLDSLDIQSSDHQAFAIVGADKSSLYFDVAGDKRSMFPAGTKFEVSGSTAFSAAMTASSIASDTFSVAGNQTATFTKGVVFTVSSGASAGTWQVLEDSTFGADTTIKVTGSVLSDVAAGNLVVSNNGLYAVASTAMSSTNTRITVTTGIQDDAGADGYIRIWD